MELEQQVNLWKRATSHGEAVYLATVVHVQGSSYRKAGARMLVTSAGERAGTISGGCLEAEVSRKIAWLTRNGSSIQCYQSSFDDDNEGVPYGLGCGGTIWILMESGQSVHAVLKAMEQTLRRRVPAVTVAMLEADKLQRTVVLDESHADEVKIDHLQLRQSRSQGRVISLPGDEPGQLPKAVYIPLLPPHRLHVFGAGDDAQPIVRFAAELGWEVTVADGRRHLLRRERFPEARHMELIPFNASSSFAREITGELGVQDGDSAVILTHSYEQDRAILKHLLLMPLRYRGILGPLHRTERILRSISEEIGLSVEEGLARLHAPVGLNIGSGNPAVIALAIIAEIQAEMEGVEVSVSRQSAFAGTPGYSDSSLSIPSLV